MTLLEHRRHQFREAVCELLDTAEHIKRALRNKTSGLGSLVELLAQQADRASDLAGRISDLEDVENYGADGGR